MNKKEFREITEMLEQNYSKEIDVRILNMWYEEFKEYPKEYYEYIIKEVIRTEKYMPTLARMIEIKKPIWFYQEIEKQLDNGEIENILKEWK